MTSNPIDPAVYDDLKATTGAEFVVELVDAFLDEAPTMIAELRAALVAGDADKFRRAAHSIKSNANVFGAHDLAGPARQLELTGLDAEAAQVHNLMSALDAEYTRASDALRQLRDG
jgi:HPt (histidine-containing phosphotransfer) domain-containing protein